MKTPSPTRSSPENSFPFAVSYQDFSRHSRGGGRRTRSSVYSARSSLVKTCACNTWELPNQTRNFSGKSQGRGRRTRSSVYSARSSLVSACATRGNFQTKPEILAGRVRGGRRTRSSVYCAHSSLVHACATRGNFKTKPEILAGRVSSLTNCIGILIHKWIDIGLKKHRPGF